MIARRRHLRGSPAPLPNPGPDSLYVVEGRAMETDMSDTVTRFLGGSPGKIAIQLIEAFLALDQELFHDLVDLVHYGGHYGETG